MTNVNIVLNQLQHLLPLDEFQAFVNLQKADKYTKKLSCKNQLKYGGLPYLINLFLEDEVVYEYLKNIYTTILFKDIITRYRIRNSDFLEKLTKYLADNVGSLLSAKKISDYLKSQKIKINANVILNYLSFLSASFLVFKVQRAEIIGKKIFKSNDKYYFQDLGIRQALIGYRQVDINKILENLVFLHMKILGYKVYVGKLANLEIDFVCEKAGEKVYIQVAYLIPNDEVRDREFGNLLKIPDNFPKIVVSMDEFTEGQYEGVKHVNIMDSLQNDKI